MHKRVFEIFAAIIILLTCAPSTLAGQGVSPPTIEVVGEARIMVEPNQATITFAVETNAAKAQQAVTENAERSARLLTALKRISGESAKIKTSGFSLSPVYAKEERIRPQGYRVRNTVALETNSLDKVGALIDEASTAGVSHVNSLEFNTDKEGQFRREAAVAAVHNAQEIANTLAEAAGLTIKKIIKISYGPSQPIRPFRVEAMAAAARTPIEVGEISVEERVRVVFEVN